MDFYGYSSYQYNQSDELAKQMFAQQALASSLPYNPDVGEPHTMPVPTGAPWNVQGMAWGSQSPPQLVQFTAQPPEEAKISPVMHTKRKSLDIIEPAIPAKQLITEERMAAHLNGLHISSDFTSHASVNEEFMDVGMTELQSSNICDRLKGHKIVLAEEIKNIQEEPLLPAALIERLEKPQMSLVVWKPKENILSNIKETDEEEGDQSLEEVPKRRNVGTQVGNRRGVLVTELTGSVDVEM